MIQTSRDAQTTNYEIIRRERRIFSLSNWSDRMGFHSFSPSKIIRLFGVYQLFVIRAVTHQIQTAGQPTAIFDSW